MPRFDPDNLPDLILLPVTATVAMMDLSEASLRERINLAIAAQNARQANAAVGPVGENQQPRMLQISAWICHAGKPNANGYDFTKEGLEAAVKNGLFQKPFLGMIDFNHNYEAIGAWYDAEFAYDPVAEAWGLLAHGAIWSWRYTDISDKLLAAQAREGRIDVSMSCLFQTGTISRDANGRSVITIHDPVFLTTSVLTEPPADADARGRGSEDVTQTEQERTRQLLRAALEASEHETPADHSQEEEGMKELIEKVEALLGEQKAELGPLVQAAMKLPEVEAKLAAAVEAKAAADASFKAFESKHEEALATLRKEVEELQSAKATLEVTLEATKTELTTASAQNAELVEFKAGVEAKEREAAEAARRAARQEEIPEAVMAALDDREDKDSLLEDWMTQDDAKWALTKATFEIVTASARKTLAQRSAEEGLLSTASDADRGGSDAISAWVRKK
jgi:hypothetical protein